MKQYNHAFDFAFEVITDEKDPQAVDPQAIRDACIKRMRDISDAEIREACSCFDSFMTENGIDKHID